MLPSRNPWRARKASGKAEVSRSPTAISITPTTTPAKSRRGVWRAPRASDSVSAIPNSAPAKAATTMPTSANTCTEPDTAVSTPEEPWADTIEVAASTATTATDEPAAVPSR